MIGGKKYANNSNDIAVPAMKRVALALQGGGSHGAFTWRVLDRLLEQDDLSIEAISGTSAGAMNAAALGYGLMMNGREGARKALYDFWRKVGKTGDSIFNPYFWQSLGGQRNRGPMAAWLGMMSVIWSPYNNPFYTNALAEVLTDMIDFNRLRTCQKPKLFICATNVRTNKRKVFGIEEISLDVLLASACLPSVFRAVEVDGEAYWDGGYMGNPVLSPLLRHSSDVVIVEVSPFRRAEIPKTAGEISDRLNEITFDASLVHEINTVNTITKLIEDGHLVNPRFRRIHFHHIEAETGNESVRRRHQEQYELGISRLPAGSGLENRRRMVARSRQVWKGRGRFLGRRDARFSSPPFIEKRGIGRRRSLSKTQ